MRKGRTIYLAKILFSMFLILASNANKLLKSIQHKILSMANKDLCSLSKPVRRNEQITQINSLPHDKILDCSIL